MRSKHRVAVSISLFLCSLVCLFAVTSAIDNADDELFLDFGGQYEAEPSSGQGKKKGSGRGIDLETKDENHMDMFGGDRLGTQEVSSDVGEFMRCIFASDVDCVLDMLEEPDAARLRVNEIRAMADRRGGTALHFAAVGSEPEITKALLDAGCDPNRRDNIGATALHWAALAGNVASMQHLLRAGADPLTHNEDGLFPIHIAASRGHVNALVHLVDSPSKSPVNVLDGLGWTALHHACNMSQLHVVNALIDLGADVHIRDKNNMHPLHIAVFGGDALIVRKLLRQKKVTPEIVANPDANITALMMAASVDSDGAAKELIAAGADIQRTDVRHYHPIHYAARFNSPKVVKVLVDAGIKVNRRDPEGLSPLMTASMWGSEAVVKVLVEQLEADVNMKDYHGSNALMWASDTGRKGTDKVVKYLLKHGADIWAYNKLGYNAMAYAKRIVPGSESVKKEVELVLIDHGAYVTNAADKSLNDVISESPAREPGKDEL